MPSVIAATNTKQPEQKSSQVMVSNPMGQAQEAPASVKRARKWPDLPAYEPSRSGTTDTKLLVLGTPSKCHVLDLETSG
jgi:hypothetical protein